MMFSQEKNEEIKRRIKRLLVKEPGLTNREIMKMLAESRQPLKLDEHYIGRIVKKVRRERIYRMDSYLVKEWLADFEDKLGEYKRYLWNIITNPQAQDKDKIAAIRELRNSDVVLFEKMFDAGVFDRKLGELKVKGILDEKQEKLLEKAFNFMRYAGGNIGRKDNNGK